MTFLYSSNLVKRILSEWALNLYICFPTFLLSYFLCGGKKKVNKTSSYEEFGIKKQNKTLIWSRICKILPSFLSLYMEIIHTIKVIQQTFIVQILYTRDKNWSFQLSS